MGPNDGAEVHVENMSLIRVAGLRLVMVEEHNKLRSKRNWPNLKIVLKMRRPKVLSLIRRSGGNSGNNDFDLMTW